MARKARLSFQHQGPAELWAFSRPRSASSPPPGSVLKPTTQLHAWRRGGGGGAAPDGIVGSTGTCPLVEDGPSSPVRAGSPRPLQPLRRPLTTSGGSTTAAAAVVGVLALAAVLVRRGKLSKGRLAELAAATLGGLLSSSCCTIQLVLNSLSLGCAGFAVLDRFRPVFLALTFSSLAYKTWRYDVRVHRNPFRSLPTWLIAAALASSPALIRAINRRRGLAALVEQQQHQQQQQQQQKAPVDVLSLLQEGGRSSNNNKGAPLKFRVTGMKCEACGNGLRNALEGLGGGVRADVLFEEGVIYVERGAAGSSGGSGGDGDLEAEVRAVVEEMGYEAERVGVP